MRVQKASRKGIGGAKPKYRCPRCGAYGRTVLRRHYDPIASMDPDEIPPYALTCLACKTYDTREHFEAAAVREAQR